MPTRSSNPPTPLLDSSSSTTSSATPRHIPGLNFLPSSASPVRNRHLNGVVALSSSSSVDSPPRKLSAALSTTGSGAPSPRRKPRRGRGGGEKKAAATESAATENRPIDCDIHKAAITRFFPASPNQRSTSKTNKHKNGNDNGNDGDDNVDDNDDAATNRTTSITESRASDGVTSLDGEKTRLNNDASNSSSSAPPQSTPGKKKKRRRKKTAAAVAGTMPPPSVLLSPRAAAADAEDQKKRQSQLTDFYRVRRSDRRPKSEKEKEEKDRITGMIKDGDVEGLSVDDIPCKGRGVVATKNFDRGEYVIEYDGDLISFDKAKERETVYRLRPEIGCYMYYFTFQNRKYCVDATSESGKLGRLINHSTKTPNLTTRLFPIDDTPHLIFVAAREIAVGEELMYDYGDRSKEAAEAHPWLKT